MAKLTEDYIELTVLAMNLALSLASTTYASVELRQTCEEAGDSGYWNSINKSKFYDKLNLSAYIVDNGIIEIANLALSFGGVMSGSFHLQGDGSIVAKASEHHTFYFEQKSKAASPDIAYAAVINDGNTVVAGINLAASTVKILSEIASYAEGYNDAKPKEEAL
jgi:hypothetical protein